MSHQNPTHPLLGAHQPPGAFGPSASTVVGRLHPATFPRQMPDDDSGPTTSHLHPSASHRSAPPSRGSSRPPSRPETPYAQGIFDDYTPNTNDDVPHLHPTLHKSIRPAEFNYLLKLKPRLNKSNYTTWQTIMYRALQTESLHHYLDPTFTSPDISIETDQAIRWTKANLFVCTVLTSTMTEEIAAQIGHIENASKMWNEARRLYSGTTATDWTLVITALVTTRYTDGEDISAHLAKMNGYRRDLLLMRRDIADDLFACFLRISMPQTWNYVFAALPDHYTSTEVERRIRDEYGVRTSQAGTATSALQATQSNTRRSRTPIPGQPFCTNCTISGHWTNDCRSKGKRMRSKKGKREDKEDEKEKEKEKGRGKGHEYSKGNKNQRRSRSHDKKANQAVADDSSSSPDRRSDSSLSAYLTGNPSHSRFGWILDSGATNHICTERMAFTTFTPANESIKGIVKDGPELTVLGTGTVLAHVSVKGRPDRTIKLLNVSYCPNARDNLMSESRMDRKGMEIVKRNGCVTIKNSDGETMIEGQLRGNLYEVNSTIAPPSSMYNAAFSARSAPNLDLWHARFGHISLKSLRYLDRHNLVTGMDLRGKGELSPCDGCAKGKHHQAPFPLTSTNRATKRIERLHMDLQGPFDVSVQGYRYTLAVIDDHTRKGWKEFLKHKDEAPETIKNLIEKLETHTGSHVKTIRSDRGGEFIDGRLQTYLRSKGITHEFSAPHTPQQNGVAERFNQTTHESALAMLEHAEMSKGFWPEAHEHANYVRNRSPTKALVRTTPNETFYGRKPSVSTLRVFGSRCHVRVPPELRRKLDSHSIDGILCGFERGSKAYKVWIPSKHKFVSSRDVIVYEKTPNLDSRDPDPTPPSKGVPELTLTDARTEGVHTRTTIPTITVEPPAPDEPAQPPLRRSERTTRPSWRKDAAEKQAAMEAEARAKRKAQREARKQRETEATAEATAPSEIGTVAQMAYTAIHGKDTPQNYHEAISGPDADEWWKAMHEEFNLLQKRGTWELVNRPKDRKVIGCRWTYVIKHGPNGEITRYKARLVAQGFSQVPGLDYSDTFSPTVRLDSLRVILHYAAAHGWHRGQDDVTGAFLHSKIDHEIYMRQPEGFADGTGKVARLLLSLYGIKQGSYLWNKHMHEKLSKNGFTRLPSDPAVYIRQTASDTAITAIHVDNALTISNSKSMLKGTRQLLHSLFEMKEEDPDWLMGIKLTDDRENRTVTLSQAQYAELLLKRFHMDTCNPVSTPMEPGVRLTKTDCPTSEEEKQNMSNYPYREALGGITWLAIVSRPDLAYAASLLGQYSANPGKTHWKALMRVFKYLRGTHDLALTLGKVSNADPNILTGHMDANWARDADDHRSTSGYAFQLGDAVVSWNSKKQSNVATSSSEAEYVALAHGAKQALWLRYVTRDIGVCKGAELPTTELLSDNTAAIAIAREARFHGRSRHIGTQFHFVRERVEDGTFEITHVPTADMLADGLTKPLTRQPHETMLARFSLSPV